jgi:hypothetical protein
MSRRIDYWGTNLKKGKLHRFFRYLLLEPSSLVDVADP